EGHPHLSWRQTHGAASRMMRIASILISLLFGFQGPATRLEPTSMTLTVGRGQLVQFPDEASRVSVSDPMIADAVVVSAHDVVLNGKAPGNTTIMIWHGDNVSPYEVTVEPDLTEVQKQLKASFPTEQIDVSSSKSAIILTGVVSDPQVAKEAASIAAVH